MKITKFQIFAILFIILAAHDLPLAFYGLHLNNMTRHVLDKEEATIGTPQWAIYDKQTTELLKQQDSILDQTFIFGTINRI